MTASLDTALPTSHMTAHTTARPTATGTRTRSADDRRRRLLRADGLVTAAVGAVALLAPTSALWGDALPGWLPRAAGAVLLLAGADLVVASSWTGRRLRLATVVCGELALAVAAACALAVALADLRGAGRELLAAVGLVSAGFGVAELRAARA